LLTGSLVDANRLRFDFTHHAPLTEEQLQHIEHNVRQVIAAVRAPPLPLVVARQTATKLT
jgi:alanyl-tRNA synthetase